MDETLARSERRALCDLLTVVGPDAPTLCTGWTAHHLAAHLHLRESDPIAAAGIIIKALAATTARRMERVIAELDFDDLVALVARGPAGFNPLRLGFVDAKVNALEFFVHHEDVRRAGPYVVRPRVLSPQTEEQLWNAAIALAQRRLNRMRVGVILQRVKDGRPTEDRAAVATGRSPVTVLGEPGELILWLFGREASSEVQLTGSAEALARLRSASLAI